MKILLERINDKYAMSAKTESGNISLVDGGGSQISPVEMLLTAFAACTVVDIVDILSKQKLDLKDIKIEVDGEREQTEQIKPFKTIHIHYTLYGAIEAKKAERAIDLAFNKYCSVSASLNNNIEKTFSFDVIDA